MRGPMVLWFLVLCLAGANGLLAQPFFFRKDIPVGEGLMAVVAGDFNGDRRPDLAVYDAYEGLFILLSAGGGNFGRPITAAVHLDSAEGFLRAADVNGDGKDDLWTRREGVFLSRGDGTFQPAQLNRPVYVAGVGDLNADGKSDLLVGDWPGTRVLLSNGDGTFRSGPTVIPVGMDSAVVADLNRDGRSDVVCSGAYGGSGGRLALLGNGNGTFGAGIEVVGNDFPGGEFLVADLNGDGLPDLAHYAGVLLGRGDGSFQSPVLYPWGWPRILYAAADFTGDGKADLVMGVGGSNSISIYPGKGDGTFSQPLAQTIGWGDRNPARVAAADLDTDGRLDLVAANNFSNTVSLLMAKAQGGPALRRAVSAASDTAIVAPQSLATLFAPTPATAAASASPPWPTRLGGISLEVRDSAGATHLAPLLFVSSTQINFQVPAGTALGEATLAIISDRGTTEAGSMQVDAVAPGLFMVSPGVVAATAVLVEADGTQVPIPVFSCSGTSCKAEPIPLSTAGDRRIYVSFYGTGFRAANPDKVICRDLLTGVRVPVLYAGPQGTPGLDQINVGPLPAALNDWGDFQVSIRIDGVAANSVRIGVR